MSRYHLIRALSSGACANKIANGGLSRNGKVICISRKINVTAPYKNIPEVLDIDVTNLQLGKSIKVAELSFEGLEIATPAEVVVCSVKATRASRSAAAQADK